MFSFSLRENFRALFYAPYYAAFALGAFEAEGVKVNLVESDGPSEASSALVQVGGGLAWGGPMRVLVAEDKDDGGNLRAFCEVVGRDPFFLVGRNPNPRFRFRDLLGRPVGTVSEVPTPWMCLQHDLRLAGVDPVRLDRVPDQSMAENVSSFLSGDLEVIQIFEPFVEELVSDGKGNVWYGAAARGRTSYTSFLAKRDTLEREPEGLLRVTRAMFRVQEWLAGREGEKIAETVAPFFPGIPTPVLVGAVTRCRDAGIWNRDPRLPREGFERLRASCISGGLIRRGADFEGCVDNRFAERVMEEDPPSL